MDSGFRNFPGRFPSGVVRDAATSFEGPSSVSAHLTAPSTRYWAGSQAERSGQGNQLASSSTGPGKLSENVFPQHHSLPYEYPLYWAIWRTAQ